MNQHELVAALLAGKSSVPGVPTTVFASANVALCKYWGKRDPELNLPRNSSLSVSLGPLGTETTVAVADNADRIILNSEELADNDPTCLRIKAFIKLLRREGPPLLIETANTVPTAAGVASSASGFAALTLALDRFFQWGLSPRDLSILARLGSGSASRSVFTGFVQWHAGDQDDGMDSYAEPFEISWPELRVGLVCVSASTKSTTSTDGMNHTTATSDLYRTWPARAATDLETIRTAIAARDFTALGEAAEANALAMHGTMLGACPPLLYWQPETVAAIQQVQHMRNDNIPVYATIDAGPNVKLLFQEEHCDAVCDAFPPVQVVEPFKI